VLVVVARQADKRGPSAIGAAVRRICTERGLTQKAIERATGLQQAYLSQIERGEIQDPGVTVLKRIADACKVSLLDFFDDPAPGRHASLDEFLKSSMAADITPEERAQLSTWRSPSGTPNQTTWYLVLQAIRSAQ
jgi:transcriptional regulator with XRE-family HTH domain